MLPAIVHFPVLMDMRASPVPVQTQMCRRGQKACCVQPGSSGSGNTPFMKQSTLLKHCARGTVSISFTGTECCVAFDRALVLDATHQVQSSRVSVVMYSAGGLQPSQQQSSPWPQAPAMQEHRGPSAFTTHTLACNYVTPKGAWRRWSAACTSARRS